VRFFDKEGNWWRIDDVAVMVWGSEGRSSLKKRREKLLRNWLCLSFKDSLEFFVPRLILDLQALIVFDLKLSHRLSYFSWLSKGFPRSNPSLSKSTLFWTSSILNLNELETPLNFLYLPQTDLICIPPSIKHNFSPSPSPQAS
jgi:hypothetical protein